MTNEQKLRLDIFKETKDLEMAKKVLEFVNGTAGRQLQEKQDCLKEGVYVIYDDGSFEPFTGINSKSNVKSIGISYDGHAFAIVLKDLGRYQLVRDIDNCPEEHPLYCETECEALVDWEFIERTRHIQEVGTDIPLAEGEYMPSLPMLVLMRAWVKKINEALEYVGGEPFDMDECYWSCTEYNRYIARTVYFYNGITYNGYKYYSYVVRPVTVFNWEA